jgi:DNA modification methylase
MMVCHIIQGDVREELPKLAADSFDCIVTSPPYYGLRDYGTASWEGGDPASDHSTARSRGDDIKPGDKQGTSAGSRPNLQRACPCGARRFDSQIGLEQTLDDYLETMVGVCRELRRLLKPSGAFFLNVADSYAPAKSLYLMPEQFGILLRKDG